MQARKLRINGILTLLLLAAVTLAVYARTLDYPFAFVDFDTKFPERNVLLNAARLSASFKREKLSRALAREYQVRSAP